ncbi:MAG: DUF6152 family protein [Candidatus Rariloculaceae bacterium]
MSFRLERRGLLVALIVALSSSAGAHHALNAFYDLDSPFELEGTLTSVRWTNPHISFELERAGPDGQTEAWSVASGSPVLIRRSGVDAETFAVGDRVRITGFPSRLREQEMVGAVIHMADGSDIPLFRSLAGRLGYDLTPSGGHIDTDAVTVSEQTAQGIFRVWSFDDDPSLREFEPEFVSSAIDARASYDPLVDDPALSCTPRGMPHAMENRFPIEFVDQGQTIGLRLEMWGSLRTIHVGDDDSTGSQQASPLGHSVGRWEDGTLVVTTTNIDWLYFDEIGTPQSAEIETEERFTLSEDDSVLDYQITITDPQILLEPAVRYARWAWVPGEEVQPYGCTPIVNSN